MRSCLSAALSCDAEYCEAQLCISVSESVAVYCHCRVTASCASGQICRICTSRRSLRLTETAFLYVEKDELIIDDGLFTDLFHPITDAGVYTVSPAAILDLM